MTEATETEIDEAIIVALSDYLDGALPADQKAEVEAKIASDPQWKTVHDEMVETRKALSGLQKARAGESFAQEVTATINQRSEGRFFARRTFGDRVPLGALLIVALLGLAVIAYVLWSSPTGSLKVDRDRPPTPAGSGVVAPP
jgi:anti-sigma factor RsiW